MATVASSSKRTLAASGTPFTHVVPYGAPPPSCPTTPGAVADPVSLLIADHAPTRLGVKIALDPEVTVCAEADEIEQAIRAAERQRPSVVLLGRGLCEDLTVRFAAVRRRIERTPAHWARIASEAGYADQPHLNREFQQFAGTTPTDFAARMIPGGWVVGDGCAPAA